MKQKLIISFTLAIALGFVYAQKSNQERISVLDFDGWKGANATEITQYGETLTDMILTKIIESHRFIVVDRKQISEIIAEQKFQTISGLVDESTAIKIGNNLGIDKFIVGSFTRNSTEYYKPKYKKEKGRKELKK